THFLAEFLHRRALALPRRRVRRDERLGLSLIEPQALGHARRLHLPRGLGLLGRERLHHAPTTTGPIAPRLTLAGLAAARGPVAGGFLILGHRHRAHRQAGKEDSQLAHVRTPERFRGISARKEPGAPSHYLTRPLPTYSLGGDVAWTMGASPPPHTGATS